MGWRRLLDQPVQAGACGKGQDNELLIRQIGGEASVQQANKDGEVTGEGGGKSGEESLELSGPGGVIPEWEGLGRLVQLGA